MNCKKIVFEVDIKNGFLASNANANTKDYTISYHIKIPALPCPAPPPHAHTHTDHVFIFITFEWHTLLIFILQRFCQTVMCML